MTKHKTSPALSQPSHPFQPHRLMFCHKISICSSWISHIIFLLFSSGTSFMGFFTSDSLAASQQWKFRWNSLLTLLIFSAISTVDTSEMNQSGFSFLGKNCCCCINIKFDFSTIAELISFSEAENLFGICFFSFIFIVVACNFLESLEFPHSKISTSSQKPEEKRERTLDTI